MEWIRFAYRTSNFKDKGACSIDQTLKNPIKEFGSLNWKPYKKEIVFILLAVNHIFQRIISGSK